MSELADILGVAGISRRLRARRRRSREIRRSEPAGAPSTAGDQTPEGPKSPAPRETSPQTADGAADEGWDIHEAGPEGAGFEVWLYQYSDGTMAAEDGTVYERTDSGQSTEAVGAEQESAPPAEREPEPEPEADPQAEAQLEPVSQGESSPEAGAEHQPEAVAEPDHAPKEIPEFIQYSPSNLPIYVLGGVLALAAGALVLTLVVTAADPTTAGLMMAALLAAVALGAGWALASWCPPVIAIRVDGVLEVANRRGETRFDLRDPATSVELGDKPGSLNWRARIGQPDGECVVIRARQVKAPQFIDIVQHHRRNLRDPHEASSGDEESSEDGG